MWQKKTDTKVHVPKQGKEMRIKKGAVDEKQKNS